MNHHFFYLIGSMGLVLFTSIWHTFMVNVGKYTSLHGSVMGLFVWGVLSCSTKGSPSFLEMVDLQHIFFRKAH